MERFHEPETLQKTAYGILEQVSQRSAEDIRESWREGTPILSCRTSTIETKSHEKTSYTQFTNAFTSAIPEETSSEKVILCLMRLLSLRW